MDTEVVYRLRGTPSTDPYSDEDTATDWSAPDELAMTTQAPAEPLFATEPLEDARVSVPIGWRLYLCEDADVVAADRMRVRGEVHKVNGDPSNWMAGGLVVQCERVEG